MENQDFENARIMMYSHDTFGLGHLRRCREIAHALVEAHRGLSVLIISGATIAGAFDYRVRVDFLKIPSVIKLRNGEYTSLSAHTKLEDTLAMRRAIIRQTAETFRPDILITDKEPMGLHGELKETLDFLKAQGTRLVLGLREVMDAPRLLEAEWAKVDMLRKIETYYDSIWAYGPEGFYNPMEGLNISPALEARIRYTGFLQRTVHHHADTPARDYGDYILVTTGGGGDGAELIRHVFAAYRADPNLTRRAVVVLGPYLPAKERSEFLTAGQSLPLVQTLEFDNRMEDLIAGAQAVVSMGGYNTFCEILSFDRPALIVPRTTPREEQLIRASRAAELGLIQMMRAEESADALRLAAVLQALPNAPRPSQAPETPGVRARDLGGLAQIAREVGGWLAHRRRPQLTIAHG